MLEAAWGLRVCPGYTSPLLEAMQAMSRANAKEREVCALASAQSPAPRSQSGTVSSTSGQMAPPEPAHKENAEKAPQAKLPPRKRDLSSYLDDAGLTDRQHECIALRLEYGLSITAISKRLGIDRSTVNEHLSAAEKKIQVHKAKERTDKNLAKVKPGGIPRR